MSQVGCKNVLRYLILFWCNLIWNLTFKKRKEDNEPISCKLCFLFKIFLWMVMLRPDAEVFSLAIIRSEVMALLLSFSFYNVRKQNQLSTYWQLHFRTLSIPVSKLALSCRLWPLTSLWGLHGVGIKLCYSFWLQYILCQLLLPSFSLLWCCWSHCDCVKC